MKKRKCITDDCKEKVTHECEECGTFYCELCAENEDYECSECCPNPPMIVRVSKRGE